MAASGIRMGKVFVEIGADPSKLFGALNRINKRIGRVGAAMQQVGARMTGVGVALAAPLGLAARHFASFDDAIRATAAVTGSLGAQGSAALAMMTDKARELGATTSFTAVEVANLMTALGRAGFKPDEINTMTESVLALARATGTDATLSAGIMAATLRQFGMGAESASRAADLLTYAANSSFNTVEDLGESLKFAGPVAKNLGMSLEDTVAILGVLGNVGIQGSQAGTAIRRLATITAGAGKELKDLFGISNTDAGGNLKPMVDILDEINAATSNMSVADRTEKMAKAFGLLGITSANVLAGSADSVRAFADGMNNIGGLSQQTAAAMDAGLGGSMRKAFSAIEGVALAIGEALAPSIRAAVDLLTSMAGIVNEFITANQGLVVGIAKAVAGFTAIGVSVYAAGAALSALSAAVGLVLSPAVLIVAAIAAIGAGIVYASGEMGSFASIASNAFGGIYDAIAGGDVALAMDILMAGLWAGWAKGSEVLLNGIDSFGAALYDVLAFAIINVKAFVLGTVDNLVNGVLAAFDNMVSAVRKSWNYVQSFLKKGFDLAAENNKVDNEMAARARARGVSRPGISGRVAKGTEEFMAAKKERDITSNAVRAQRASSSLDAMNNLEGLRQQAADKRQDVGAARDLETSISQASSLDQLSGLGSTLADLIERGNLSTDREQQLIDAYNQASQRIGEATTQIAANATGKADPGAMRDAAIEAAAAQAETVGTFSSVGFGGMGFGGSLQEKANELLGKIEQNTREPGLVGA